MAEGRIVKALSGFYYVKSEETGKLYACRARGLFRKEGKKPLVGDFVSFEVTHEQDAEGNVTVLHPRKNALVRPTVANVDQAVVIFAVRLPDPVTELIDRDLVLMQRTGLPAVLVFNKSDLGSGEDISRLSRIYEGAVSEIVFTSAVTGEGLPKLRDLLSGRTSTVAGPSGAGKSSLINRLSGESRMETGELSRKIGRGKQTTRHVEVQEIGRDTWLIDTPGFSMLELPDMEAGELSRCFPEIAGYEGHCYFTGCAHIHEPSCGVREALEEGKIPEERYRSYVSFYDELKNRRKY